MVRKCFLWPAAIETTLTSDIKADATFIDVNDITTDMTEVLKYVLVLNFKKDVQLQALYMTCVVCYTVQQDCVRALEK